MKYTLRVSVSLNPEQPFNNQGSLRIEEEFIVPKLGLQELATILHKFAELAQSHQDKESVPK